MSDCRDREHGLALVSVLWGVSILSLIAAAMMSTGTLTVRAERNMEWELETTTLSDAGFHRAVLALTDTRTSSKWPVDGTPQPFVFGDAAMAISIEDEAGKIDLNFADAALLTRLFQSQGLSPDQAGDLASRILDWRSASNLRSAAADRIDPGSGRSFRPRGGPLQSVDEVRLIPGMSSELFDRVAPALTVYSQRAVIDPLTAPKQALLALPGMDADKLASTVAQRQHAVTDPLSIYGAAAAGIIDPASGAAGRAYTISVDFEYRDRHVSHKMVLRITQDPLRPYLVLSQN